MESALCGSALIVDDPTFRLIETFGFSPLTGVERLEMHLTRLERSARFFDIPYDPVQVQSRIAALTSAEALRCRLTLDIHGDAILETAPLPEAVSQWTFAISPIRLRADDVFLQHKTTRRDVYNKARQNLPEGIDEWLFLNEEGTLCEGTITNLVVERTDGTRVTPPLSSGCLPGVFRQSLLEAGEITEAPLTLGHLRSAKSIAFTNALRGEIPAIWVQTP